MTYYSCHLPLPQSLSSPCRPPTFVHDFVRKTTLALLPLSFWIDSGLLLAFYSLLRLLLAPHLCHAFNVIGPGEHVYGLKSVQAKAEEVEKFQVPRERRGIAGNIDDLLGDEGEDPLQCFQSCAGSRGVEDDGMSVHFSLY